MSESNQWIEVVRRLGPAFAERAAAFDEEDRFVADNFAELKEAGIFTAGVPSELGGGGASHRELCEMIRELATFCSSTGLAVSMHTHLCATLSYLWRKGNPAPEGILRRVAAEKLILISTGGSDWLDGSGKLEKADGGYRLSGRKIFGSGVPAGDILMTTGIWDDPKDGPTVIHLPVPIKSAGVKILDTWRVMGMRATGSQDIELDGVFIPDAAMGGVRRQPGKWHPFMQTVALVALPVIYAAYLGVAQRARTVAVELVKRKATDPNLPYLLGEMQNRLTAAELAWKSMLDLVETAPPGPETTNQALIRRALVGEGVIGAVDKALEAVGGRGFYRQAQLERLLRDVRGAQFHPVPEKPQTRLTGRMLLGLGLDG